MKRRRPLGNSSATYTLFTVKHVAQVFVGLGVLANEGEDPFIGFVIRTEGYSV